MRVNSNNFVVSRSVSSALISLRMDAPESIVTRSVGNVVTSRHGTEKDDGMEYLEQSEFNFFQNSPKVSFRGAEIALVRAAKRCPNAKRME
jgi:hypothetical protein